MSTGKPRNAYEQAVQLLEEIKRAATDRKLVAQLDELWRLFELCIPAVNKPK